ncbi:MAG: hypothetical protein JNM00_10555, partial [Flavobacteriales bacterium]|nr:hypothetical protein [Flavobacteriales bacterium]
FVEGFGASEVDFSIGTINEGCTDPEATNYLTYPFTDVPLYNCNDGSCCYANAYMLTLEDSYGDGWNGGSISFQNSYDIEGSYTLEAGSISSQEICLPDGCYIAVVVGGEFPSEISWSLTPLYQGGGLNIDDILNPFGTTHTGTNNAPVSGGAPALVSFEAGDAVPGCTSPSANNYEPYAVCNDGSCEYCDANMTLELFDTGNDGWEGHTLTIYEAGIGLVANYTLKEGGYRIIQLCLPPSCNPYYAVVEQGFGGSEVSYSIQRWSDGAVFSGAPGEIIGFHASGVVFGCMDSSALNYNPAANCADCNGCEYPTVGSCPGDLDNNGIVNVSDLLLFSATFGTSCE